MAKIIREYRTEDVLRLIIRYGNARFDEAAYFSQLKENQGESAHTKAEKYLRQLKELLSL